MNVCDQSDVTLKIGRQLWHGHSQLLSRHSQFFRDLFDGEEPDQTAVIELPLLCPHPSDVQVLMEYLYTGLIPSGIKFTAHVLETAHNSRYVGADALYEACATQLAATWLELYEERKAVFTAFVDTRIMVATLPHMVRRDLQYQMEFMCAACPNVDNADWVIAATRFFNCPVISKKLTSKELQNLRERFKRTEIETRLFSLIPATIAFDQGQAGGIVQLNLKECRRCGHFLRPEIVDHDVHGCYELYHPSGLRTGGSGLRTYACCNKVEGARGCRRYDRSYSAHQTS